MTRLLASSAPAPAEERDGNTAFDCVMLVLAAVLFLGIASAAWILVTLPEALDVVANPALGAPWMTSRAPATALAPPSYADVRAMRCDGARVDGRD